jgi:preprotein translocase subunit SecA
LVEYQREGFELFGAMMEGIAEESVGFLFNLEVQVEESDDDADDEALQLSAKGLGVKSAPQALSYSAPSEDGEVEVRGETAEEETPETEARRVANAKNKARQKSKQQRKSRKNNR